MTVLPTVKLAREDHRCVASRVSGTLNGNRWGLKGVEDLGGGMKAVFQLENGFDGSGRLKQGYF